ncbi:MAG: dihydrofolate reductase [Bacteroidales bacterium]|nr:dihydrofolate reductase [Bacteroidales bacterium]
MGKTLSIIVAIAADNGIGYRNNLLAHLPGDLKRFKSITSGKTVIMGRNTWFSLPKRPLPNRQNIVITNIPGETFDGAVSVNSVDEAIALCPENAESFVIGGAMVYKQFFPLATKLYITRIHNTFEADTFFPEIKDTEWHIESSSEIFSDENNGLSYQYFNFIRN